MRHGRILLGAVATAGLLSGLTLSPGVQAQSSTLPSGWYYLTLARTIGHDAIITAVAGEEGRLAVRATYQAPSRSPLLTLGNRALYVELPEAHLVAAGHPAMPAAPAAPAWTLLFPNNRPVLANGAERIPWPKAVPTYLSLVNPATEPGPLDNQVVGQEGPWLWIALKGPAKPPYPLVWHYRYWNRLVAFNVTTRRYQVYPIPRSTSLWAMAYGWGRPPAFGVVDHRVLIGVGAWLGVFPLVPPSAPPPVRVRPPAWLVAERAQHMLRSLTTLYWQASDGLAAAWNCGVMQDTSPKACPSGTQPFSSWILDPAIFNHGDFPATLLWAADFPLTPGSPQDRERARLVTGILRMASSPLPLALIATGDNPQAIRSRFHDTPPTPLPGYVIRDGYYWALTGSP